MKATIAQFLWLFAAVICLVPLERDKKVAVGSSPGDPESPSERMEYLRKVRGNKPNLTAKMHAITSSRKQWANRRKEYLRDAGIPEWEELGPTTIGGRIRAVTINPDNPDQIFVGGVAGGVWVSNDGGLNWAISTPNHLSVPVTSLAIDPDNSSTIYATTGESLSGGNTGYSISFMDQPGVGVLKSTNGGSSWSVLKVDPGRDYWLNKIVINPEDSDILYACGMRGDLNQQPNVTNEGGILYRSNDGGNSWQVMLGPLTIARNIIDIEINPLDTGEIYLGTNRTVLKRNSSTMLFEQMIGNDPDLIRFTPNGRRCEVALCASDPSTAYVLRFVRPDTSELWMTTDTTWTLITTDVGKGGILGEQGSYDNTIWIDSDDCSQVIMGGIQMWKWAQNQLTRISNSGDDIGGAPGGNDKSIHADQHIIVPHPNYGGTNDTVYIGNDGGLYMSDDIWNATPNTTWHTRVPGLAITQLYGVSVSRSGDTIYGGSQDNSLFVNCDVNNGTQNWKLYRPTDGGHGAIKPSDPDIIYASRWRGRILKSENGGDSYCAILNIGNQSQIKHEDCDTFLVQADNALFIAPLEMDPNDEETIYVGANRLWRSTDEGVNWSTITTGTPNVNISTVEIAPGNANEIWLGYDNGTIQRTTDGGTNWSNITDPALPGKFVTDIAINPNDNTQVTVTFGAGYSDDVIWYSDDAGASWQNRSLPDSMQVYCAIWHPTVADWLYVGTDIGIFASEDAGQNWSITPLISGHPSGIGSDGPVFIAVVELVWQGDGSELYPYFLVAATHGRGIWRTTIPIRSKYYVDKDCDPCGTGSFAAPFEMFTEAVAAAGTGSEIVFLSGGTYDEVPPTLLVKKRLRVTIHSSVSGSVVLE